MRFTLCLATSLTALAGGPAQDDLPSLDLEGEFRIGLATRSRWLVEERFDEIESAFEGSLGTGGSLLVRWSREKNRYEPLERITGSRLDAEHLGELLAESVRLRGKPDPDDD